MKKKKVILIFATSFLLFGCGETKVDHDYSTTWTKDDIYHWHDCTIEGHDDTDEKASHTFGEWTTLTEAGVHKDRVDHRLCSVCNYEEKKTISDTGIHSYNLNEWKKDETGHWHESTCEHDTPLKGDFSEHSGDWTVKTEATYTSNRFEERDCSVCGYHEEKEIENSKLNKKERELSVGEITGLVYNGLEQGIPDSIITKTNDYGGLKIEYREKGTEVYTKAAPVDALTYEYKVTLNGTEEWEEKVVTGEYTIAKATVNINTTKTSFTDKTTTSSFGILLYSIDVSTISNNALDYVNVFAPNKYAVGGVHSIPTSELILDNSNFELNIEGLSSISLINYDTSAFIADISDIFFITGKGTIIETTIYQGTLNKGDSIYIYELDKTAVVESISMFRAEVSKATKGQNVSLLVPSLDKDELERGMTFTKSSEDRLNTSLTISSTLYVKTNEEGGQKTPLMANSIRVLRFNGASTTYSVRIVFSNEDGYVLPGNSVEVMIEFGEKIPSWANREFDILNGSNVIATGKVKEQHNHSDSFVTTGNCENCDITHQENLTLDSNDTAVSSEREYLYNEFMIYTITLHGEGRGTSGTGATYKFTLTDSTNFSMKVYSTLVEVKEVTLDSDNCLKVSGSSNTFAIYKIIVSRNDVVKNNNFRNTLTIAKQ